MDAGQQLLSITNRGPDVLIRVRGAFDSRAVHRLCELLEDLIARGGAISEVVLDLGATTECSTRALVEVASLMSAGMRLSAVPSDARARRSGGHARDARASVV